ncbi:MAG: alcohol dehydrogenase [candidate division NC10 bacterium CSP1-5]|nr:MAG: alcohol dehydrogenase [candidate division NC10 bacterium CSP1-5]
MKAVRFHAHGGPEVLKLEEIPEPRIAQNQVLVRIKSCALNHLDLWLRKGLPGVKVPLPHIPGCDIAGEVAAVGELCTRVKVGEPVVISPGISCGQCARCLEGRDNLCPSYQIIGGYGLDGGYADLIAVPEVNVLPLPKGLDFIRAAAFPLTFLTAWNMLVTLGNVRPGQTVLVMGAGSGVGVAALQIAKLFGATVIATASTGEKLAKAQNLGADHGINYRDQSIGQEVKRVTERRGVDIVFEHVGGETWKELIPILAADGTLVTCGATSGPIAETDIRYLFMRQLRIQGAYMGRKADLLTIVSLVEAGKLKPVVDQALPLAEAPQAHRLLEDRRQFGKVVLTI